MRNLKGGSMTHSPIQSRALPVPALCWQQVIHCAVVCTQLCLPLCSLYCRSSGRCATARWLRCPRSALTKGSLEKFSACTNAGGLPQLLLQGHTSFSQCRYNRVQELLVPGSPVVRGIVQGIVSIGDESQRPQEGPIQCRSIEVALHRGREQACRHQDITCWPQFAIVKLCKADDSCSLLQRAQPPRIYLTVYSLSACYRSVSIAGNRHKGRKMAASR